MPARVGAAGKVTAFVALAVLLMWAGSSRNGWARIDVGTAGLCETMSRVSAFRDDNPDYDPDFAVAIKEKRWDDVRSFLMQGYLLPEGLTTQQKARIARERLSAALIPASAGGDRATVLRLLRRGADPNTQASLDDYVFPLAWAARCDHPEIVKILLAHGAKVNARFTYPGSQGWVVGSTALQWAIESDARRSVAILLANGANPRLVSSFKPLEGLEKWAIIPKKNETLLDYAYDKDVRKMLWRALRHQQGTPAR